MVRLFILLASVFFWQQLGHSKPDRFVLIGAIKQESANEGSGVVIYGDMKTRRSYTVRVGEPLPSAPEFLLVEVRREGVVVKTGNESILIRHRSYF